MNTINKDNLHMLQLSELYGQTFSSKAALIRAIVPQADGNKTTRYFNQLLKRYEFEQISARRIKLIGEREDYFYSELGVYNEAGLIVAAQQADTPLSKVAFAAEIGMISKEHYYHLSQETYANKEVEDLADEDMDDWEFNINISAPVPKSKSTVKMEEAREAVIKTILERIKYRQRAIAANLYRRGYAYQTVNRPYGGYHDKYKKHLEFDRKMMRDLEMVKLNLFKKFQVNCISELFQNQYQLKRKNLPRLTPELYAGSQHCLSIAQSGRNIVREFYNELKAMVKEEFGVDYIYTKTEISLTAEGMLYYENIAEPSERLETLQSFIRIDIHKGIISSKSAAISQADKTMIEYFATECGQLTEEELKLSLSF